MTWDTYQSSVMRSLPKGSSVDQTPEGGVAVTLQCRHGHTGKMQFPRRIPEVPLKRAFRNEGWKFHGGKATCPDHSKHTTGGKEVHPIIISETKPSPALKAAKRQALMWLDECFDVEKGCYKEDMSDAKVGEQVGLSANCIAKMREEFGYEIKADPELVALQERAKKVEDEIKRIQSDCSSLCSNLLKEVSEFKQQIASKLP